VKGTLLIESFCLACFDHLSLSSLHHCSIFNVQYGYLLAQVFVVTRITLAID
jgi:hypothetical protein